MLGLLVSHYKHDNVSAGLDSNEKVEGNYDANQPIKLQNKY